MISIKIIIMPWKESYDQANFRFQTFKLAYKISNVYYNWLPPLVFNLFVEIF